MLVVLAEVGKEEPSVKLGDKYVSGSANGLKDVTKICGEGGQGDFAEETRMNGEGRKED